MLPGIVKGQEEEEDLLVNDINENKQISFTFNNFRLREGLSEVFHGPRVKAKQKSTKAPMFMLH